MHRVDDSGDGYADNFYHDKLAPARGTIDFASEANSEMMELCNVVTLAGDTIAASAAADQAAGWHQVYDAIFGNGHLTDSAIDHLSFDVITAGTIDVTSGVHDWLQNVSGLGYTDSVDDASSNISAGISNLEYHGVRTIHDGRGVRYANGPGDSASFKAMYLRQAFYANISLTSTTWAEQTTGTGVWIWSGSYTTDIPATSTILGVKARVDNGTKWTFPPAGCAIEAIGGFWQIQSLSLSNGLSSINVSDLQLMVEYDATDIVTP